jgi:23S rRNA pseudouridine1911/1915/1917 synthase
MPPADPGTPEPFDVHTFTADRGDGGVRLDLVLLRWLTGRVALSRRRVQAAIDEGRVSVNGVAATKSAARVVTGDRVEACLPAARRRAQPQPQRLPLEVLYEDAHLLAVNKPPGMVVHPSYKHADGTLFNALLWHVQAQRVEGAEIPHLPYPPRPERAQRVEGPQVVPRLLGRLDKDTSGVVLVSKTRAAHAAVVRDAGAGGVCKEYLALVHGVPMPPSGTISRPLQRDGADVRRVVEAPGGKASTTRYTTLASDAAGGCSLVRCELVTGRMHQIRVHLASRGWPIVGDRVYGLVPDSLEATFPRQALHAWRVTLPHPITRARLVVEAPVPDDMRGVCEARGLSWMTPAVRPEPVEG